MNKHLPIIIITGLILGGLGLWSNNQESSLGAFGDPFLSIQLATSPTNNYILSTDGTDNSWIVNSGGGGSGDPFAWTPDDDTGGVSTSTLIQFDVGFISSASSTIVGDLSVVGSIFAIKDVDFTGLKVGESSAKRGAMNWRNILERLEFNTFNNTFPIDFAGSFQTFSPGGTERVRIDSSGNVGIGTDSPVVTFTPTLQIEGSNPAFIIDDSDSGVDYLTTNVASGVVNIFFDVNAKYNIGTAGDNVGVGFSEKFTINSSGNVGIGDTTPTYKLTVNGNAQFASFVDASYFVATSSSDVSIFAGGFISSASSTINAGLVVTGNLSASSTLTLSEYMDFGEISTPADPVTNTMRIWVEDNNGKTLLKIKNGDGLEKILAHDSAVVVRNSTGGDLSKGDVVYVTGVVGNVMTVALSKADATSTMPATGMLIEDIANNGFGFVAHISNVKGLDTSMFSEGDELFVSTSTAGGLTNIKPVHPFLEQHIGTVTKSNVGSGIIHVNADSSDRGEETGTISNEFHIGNQTGSQKIDLHFENSSSGILQWTPTADRLIIIPDASGTLAISASGNIALDGSGNITINDVFLFNNADDATTGTLTVANIVTLADAFINGGDLNIGTGSATSTLTSLNGNLGLGSTTPFSTFSISGGSLITTAVSLATTSSMTIDWTVGNQQEFTIGTGVTTIAFEKYTAAAHLRLVLCQNGSGSGTVTWLGVTWQGGTAPTLTTTADHCDVLLFLGTNATSTNRETNATSTKIFGSSSLDF